MNRGRYERLKNREEKKRRRKREEKKGGEIERDGEPPAEPLADVKLNDTIIYPSQ